MIRLKDLDVASVSSGIRNQGLTLNGDADLDLWMKTSKSRPNPMQESRSVNNTNRDPEH